MISFLQADAMQTSRRVATAEISAARAALEKEKQIVREEHVTSFCGSVDYFAFLMTAVE